MKLYTEEEIRKFFTEKYNEELSIDELIEILTPIELPSDEEIHEELDIKFNHRGNMVNLANYDGAKWMRDKIQGGNK